MKKDYDPFYWVEGTFNGRNSTDPEKLKSIIYDISSKGWQGVLYWGADRRGEKMEYYFKSPFLEKQPWAAGMNDNLSPVVKAAHEKGLKLMINIEGINPYHWKENQWTPENIRAVADDIAAAGADAVFEECFEVKPDVFLSLASELKRKGVDYISGTDPMLFRESNFTTLWPETAIINIYNYYLKRDKIFNTATLAQHGSLGYGWAKYWNKPTMFLSPINRNWGIAGDYSPAVISYLCMIRALQFRVDNFMIFGGLNTFDPVKNRAWITGYVNKQEKDRPLMNVIVLLKTQKEYSGSAKGDQGWNSLFNSGDAITSGAFNAGYNIVVSDRVLPADAYWIYARGGNEEILPADVVSLFNADKPVFIQCAGIIPSGEKINAGWKTVLGKCGVDADKPFSALVKNEEVNNEEMQELPYTGYYNDVYLRFTGTDVQRGIDLRSGTVIPPSAISGTVYCNPNKTYGRGPFITGKNKKYVISASTLNWETAYPVSHLLSGAGILPSSNVWGIAGKNVTALLAIETTMLNLTIPGLNDGAEVHVVIWDKKHNKKFEEKVTYKAPYKQLLEEYDLILIDRIK